MINLKNALVTGYDTSIIARETSKMLVEKGFNIIAICNNESCCKNYSEITDLKLIECNLSDPASVKSLIKSLKSYCFDVIVNCHAVLATTDDNQLRHEFFDFNYEEFDKTLRSNITSIVSICMGLKDNIQRGGCIVNVTSSAAEEGGFATISYNASKAAIKNISKSLANNFGAYNGVRVNCVAPGWIPQNKNVVAGNIVELANKITPLSYYGESTNVAAAILSLIENPYANSTTYSIDGGITSSYLMYMLESLDLKGNNAEENIKKMIECINEIKAKLSK